MVAYFDIETASDGALVRDEMIAAGFLVADDDLGRVLIRPGAREWLIEHAGDHALDPHGGRVICWAIATSDDREIVRSSTDETELLGELLGALRTFEPSSIAAWNGHGFDFPFLRARALARSLPELARWFWQAKPWDGLLVDPSEPGWFPRPVRGGAKGWTWSLDAAADLLGVERPPTTPGAEVPAAWYLGRAAEVAAHCLDDVRTLRAVTRLLAAGRGDG